MTNAALACAVPDATLGPSLTKGVVRTNLMFPSLRSVSLFASPLVHTGNTRGRMTLQFLAKMPANSRRCP